MMIKWVGSVMIFAGCGGFGISLAHAHRKKEKSLQQLYDVLSVMECELRYRLTPLPELCALAAKEADGAVRKQLMLFSKELDRRISPDAAGCMRKVLENRLINDRTLTDVFLELGRSLGRYDLEGQLQGIGHVKERCAMLLESSRRQRTERIRCYETLGLCAGAALVILLV